MYIKQIYTGCLAQAAYYIESGGEAAIIDPLRETAPYISLANERGTKIKYIFETHFHADFVSGHVDLANETGATIVYGPTAKTQYDVHVAQDGEEFKLGKLIFKVLHTPGHTLESSTFLLKDEQGKNHCIFTGDTLFIGDVGRPDLAVKGDLTKEDLAGMLYDSLWNKIMPLEDEVIVYPAHGAGSACGKNMSKETSATLGNQKQFNYALQKMPREHFIQQVTEGIKPPPQYFPKNAAINKSGYESYKEVLEHGKRPLTIEQVEEEVKEGALILDTREPENFTRGFIPGSLNIPLDGSFAMWAGTLIPDLTRPIIVIAERGRLEEAITRLARVGYDHTIGYVKQDIEEWREAGKRVDVIDNISAADLSVKKNGIKPKILDVRSTTEYESQHMEGAENFPLEYINENFQNLSREEKYYLHCKSGYRSTIAASILKSIGVDNIVNINDGFDGILKTGIPVTNYACPSTV